MCYTGLSQHSKENTENSPLPRSQRSRMVNIQEIQQVYTVLNNLLVSSMVMGLEWAISAQKSVFYG